MSPDMRGHSLLGTSERCEHQSRAAPANGSTSLCKVNIFQDLRKSYAYNMPTNFNSRQMYVYGGGGEVTASTLGNSPNLIHLEFSEAQLTHQCQNQNERKLLEETLFPSFHVIGKKMTGSVFFPSEEKTDHSQSGCLVSVSSF